MQIERSINYLRMKFLEMQAQRKAAAAGARLAPGSLRVPKARVNHNQTFLLERAEELGPIFKVWLPHKMTTCIVGHDLSRRFLSDNEGKLRAGTPDLSPLFPHGFLRALEGEVHRTYRRQILDAFNNTPVEDHETAVRAIIRDGLAKLAAFQQPVTNAVIRQTMKAMSTAIFLRLILGVDRNTERFEAFVSAYDIYAPDGPFITVEDRHKTAYRTIRLMVDRLIEDIRRDPDAPPSLLRHLIRSDTVNDTTLGNLIQMVEATRYDVHGLWTWILKHLGDNPEAVHLARGDHVGENGGCPALQAIPRESLRMEQSEMLRRVATEDIVFDGFFIPKRSHIRICVWEAHHDPMKFADPFVYKCERFMTAKVPASLYSPFGLDKHRCLGADWTYSLSALMVEELTSQYTWTITDDGIPEMGKFHFEPNRTFSVKIGARAGSAN